MELCHVGRASLSPSAALLKRINFSAHQNTSMGGNSLRGKGLYSFFTTSIQRHARSVEVLQSSGSRNRRGLRGRWTASGTTNGPDLPSQPPQEVVLKAISEVSRLEGRNAKTTNMVIGGTEDPYGEDWIELDKKVNTYPNFRGFTAIGTGGPDFVKSMVGAVESVLQEPVPADYVKQRESTKGHYISVTIGPLRVESSVQVREIYQAMRRDDRMRYFL